MASAGAGAGAVTGAAAVAVAHEGGGGLPMCEAIKACEFEELLGRRSGVRLLQPTILEGKLLALRDKDAASGAKFNS